MPAVTTRPEGDVLDKNVVSHAASTLRLSCCSAPVPITSGRSDVWLNPLKSVELLYTVNGAPLCTVVMPEICHPPKTWREIGLLQPRIRWPGPMGTSMTYVKTARCRRSKLEGPQSALRWRGSATLPG